MAKIRKISLQLTRLRPTATLFIFFLTNVYADGGWWWRGVWARVLFAGGGAGGRGFWPEYRGAGGGGAAAAGQAETHTGAAGGLGGAFKAGGFRVLWLRDRGQKPNQLQ